MLNQKCGDTCDMKGNSEFGMKTEPHNYIRHLQDYTKLGNFSGHTCGVTEPQDYIRNLQDHAKFQNFSGQTCGVSPFEDANKQSLKS